MMNSVVVEQPTGNPMYNHHPIASSLQTETTSTKHYSNRYDVYEPGLCLDCISDCISVIICVILDAVMFS